MYRQRLKEFGIALALTTALTMIFSNVARADCRPDNDGRLSCSDTTTIHARRHMARHADANGNGAQIIGGRPSGCPRAYCGCGLAKFLGLTDKRLNLAWNWARLFPRANPAPGHAAVWRHHVAYIVRMGEGKMAYLRDYNSGGGLSRLHWRSIAGAVVVDPSQKLALN